MTRAHFFLFRPGDNIVLIIACNPLFRNALHQLLPDKHILQGFLFHKVNALGDFRRVFQARITRRFRRQNAIHHIADQRLKTLTFRQLADQTDKLIFSHRNIIIGNGHTIDRRHRIGR